MCELLSRTEQQPTKCCPCVQWSKPKVTARKPVMLIHVYMRAEGGRIFPLSLINWYNIINQCSDAVLPFDHHCQDALQVGR